MQAEYLYTNRVAQKNGRRFKKSIKEKRKAIEMDFFLHSAKVTKEFILTNF